MALYLIANVNVNVNYVIRCWCCKKDDNNDNNDNDDNDDQ